MSRSTTSLCWIPAFLVATGVVAASLSACSSSEGDAPPATSVGDAGDDAQSSADAGSNDLDAADAALEFEGDAADAGADAALSPDGSTPIEEKEPNDSEGTIQTLPAPPVAIQGHIDPVGDIDAYRLKLTAGEFLVWHIEPSGTAWSPYLGVIEKADSVPRYVGQAASGAFEIEQFVTRSSDWNLVVSDWNNIKQGATKVGGPAFSYVVTVDKVKRTPTPVTVGSSQTGSLATPYAAALFSLTLATETALDIEVRAKRKASPSDLDSRLTLFDTNKAQWVATNDDLAQGQTDSKLGSDGLPPGSYIVVVENVDPAAKDGSFELSVTARP